MKCLNVLPLLVSGGIAIQIDTAASEQLALNKYQPSKGSRVVALDAGLGALLMTGWQEMTQTQGKVLPAALTGVGVGMVQSALLCTDIPIQTDFSATTLASFMSKTWYSQFQGQLWDYSCAKLEPNLNYVYPQGYAFTINNGLNVCLKWDDAAQKKDQAMFHASECGQTLSTTYPWWISQYNETDLGGYAIVMTGQPNWPSYNGLCTYLMEGDAGFWLYTREKNPSQELLDYLHTYMTDTMKFDQYYHGKSVDQTGCED